jgi:hypothetical protein
VWQCIQLGSEAKLMGVNKVVFRSGIPVSWPPILMSRPHLHVPNGHATGIDLGMSRIAAILDFPVIAWWNCAHRNQTRMRRDVEFFAVGVGKRKGDL